MSARRRRILLLAALALGVAPHGARAQRGMDLDSATTAGVLHEVELASGRGLPTEPLLAKAREGRVKRAPGPRIRGAVAALAVRLDSARTALGPAASTDELVAGADALAAGANPAALRALRGASTQRSVSVALGALTQLVASGVPVRRATSMIVELLRRNATAALVIAFGNAVESDAASGLPVEEAAAFRLRAASAGTLGTGLSDATSPSVLPPGVTSAGTTYIPPPASSPRRRP